MCRLTRRRPRYDLSQNPQSPVHPASSLDVRCIRYAICRDQGVYLEAKRAVLGRIPLVCAALDGHVTAGECLDYCRGRGLDTTSDQSARLPRRRCASVTRRRQHLSTDCTDWTRDYRLYGL